MSIVRVPEEPPHADMYCVNVPRASRHFTFPHPRTQRYEIHELVVNSSSLGIHSAGFS